MSKAPKQYLAPPPPTPGTPTKDEHDAWVAKHGCPYTERWMRHLESPRVIRKVDEE